MNCPQNCLTTPLEVIVAPAFHDVRIHQSVLRLHLEAAAALEWQPCNIHPGVIAVVADVVIDDDDHWRGRLRGSAGDVIRKVGGQIAHP